MNRLTFLLSTFCLLSLIGLTTHVWSQQNPDPFAGRPSAEPYVKPRGMAREVEGRPRVRDGMRLANSQGPTRRRVVTETATVERVVEVPVTEEEFQAMKEFQDAVGVLKDSKDDAVRKRASESIHAQLVKQFEQDLKQRQDELSSVEEKLASLRQQLEKRKSQQADIIALRLKTIVNNAEGLGFPGVDAADPSLNFSDPAEFQRVSDEFRAIRGDGPHAPEMEGDFTRPAKIYK